MTAQKNSAARHKTRNIVLAIVAVAVLVLTVVLVGEMAHQNRLEAAGTEVKKSANSGRPADPALNLEHRKAADPMALGKVDAPVVMIEYSDFRCPFCGVYARKTQPEIIKKYVETGQLRIEWRDLPVLGEESVRGAVAARAAAGQGLFWEYNEAIYAAAPERGKAELNEKELLEFARQAGIPDMAKFQIDMKSPELMALVRADLAEGTGLGLNSTPTFVINNQAIPGAQPMEIFTQVIDEALAGAKTQAQTGDTAPAGAK